MGVRLAFDLFPLLFSGCRFSEPQVDTPTLVPHSFRYIFISICKNLISFRTYFDSK
jgi:hypothetical protein